MIVKPGSECHIHLNIPISSYCLNVMSLITTDLGSWYHSLLLSSTYLELCRAYLLHREPLSRFIYKYSNQWAASSNTVVEFLLLFVHPRGQNSY